eukprot:750546-Hanusia_phi.AAC.3
MGTPGSGDALKMAEPLTGDLLGRYRKVGYEERAAELISSQLARDEGLWLSLGGFHERKTREDTKIYNTHVRGEEKGREGGAELRRFGTMLGTRSESQMSR